MELLVLSECKAADRQTSRPGPHTKEKKRRYFEVSDVAGNREKASRNTIKSYCGRRGKR